MNQKFLKSVEISTRQNGGNFLLSVGWTPLKGALGRTGLL